VQIEAIKLWAQEKMLTADESPLEPGYRWYHGHRVAKLAANLAKQEQLQVNEQILKIGALLHDVGKAGYKGPEPHGPRGGELIRREIGYLFHPQELEQVVTIVANHYERPNSKYWRGKQAPNFPAEGLLVQDADIIDHFGANAIWLTIHHSAHEQRNQAATIERFHRVDPAWHHEAMASLNFQASRRELAHRLAWLHQFYAQWQREEQGELTYLQNALEIWEGWE